MVGLQGSGDTLRNAPFTEQAVQAMLERLGLNVHGASLRNRNVAAVIVTADLPAGMEAGSRLDVTVSALGDAPSLMGGTLLLTQLQAADGTIYATAQGAVSVTGFDAQGQGETLSQGVPTAGRIPNGAIVEHAVPGRRRIALDARTEESRLRDGGADRRRDQRLFRAALPRPCGLRGRQPHGRAVPPAQCLVRALHGGDRRTAGRAGHGRARRPRRAHRHRRGRTGRADLDGRGDLRNADGPGQRAAAGLAARPVLERADGRHAEHQIDVEQGGGPIAIVGGSSLRALVSGLNRIGVKPPGIIAILQAIKTAGALQADLVIQ